MRYLKLKEIILNLIFKLLIGSIIVHSLVNSAYAYSLKQIKFSTLEYNRYILPQMRSIVQDYYTALRIYSEQEDLVQQIQNAQNQFYRNWADFEKSCSSKSTDDCPAAIEKIDQSLAVFLNFFEKNILKATVLKNLNESRDNFLRFRFDSWSNLIKLESLIDLIKLQIKFKIRPNYDHELIYLRKYANYVDLAVTVIQIELGPEETRDFFRTVFYGFIYPMKERIINSDNGADVFKHQLKELNFSWNEFNVQMSKRIGPISNKKETILSTMHRRWNSILRVALQN